MEEKEIPLKGDKQKELPISERPPEEEEVIVISAPEKPLEKEKLEPVVEEAVEAESPESEANQDKNEDENEDTEHDPATEDPGNRDWDRDIKEKGLKEKFVAAGVQFFQMVFSSFGMLVSSKFLLLILGGILSGVMVGFDMASKNTWYAVVHAGMVVLYVRCLVLLYHTARKRAEKGEEIDDDVLSALTEQRD